MPREVQVPGVGVGGARSFVNKQWPPALPPPRSLPPPRNNPYCPGPGPCLGPADITSQTPASPNQSPILVKHLGLSKDVPIAWNASSTPGTLIHPSRPQFQCHYLSEVIPTHHDPSCPRRVPFLRLPTHPQATAKAENQDLRPEQDADVCPLICTTFLRLVINILKSGDFTQLLGCL